jgi:transposase
MRRTAHGSGLGRWRWVVERTFAWLNQFRRLRVRYDKWACSGFVDSFRKADTMSTPMAETTPRSRRPRRRFDDDFKAQAVRLVLDEGKSIGAVARDLDLTETALREWVQRARANGTRGRTGLTTAERDELTQLRKENRQLRLEREILKNAAAFFAKEPATRSR